MAIIEKITLLDTKIKEMKASVGLKENVPLDELVAKVASGGGTTTKSNIYKVASIEERDAITDMVEGDMCVVHTNSISNMQVTDSVTAITFPATVTIPTSIVDHLFTSMESEDRSIYIDMQGSTSSFFVGIMGSMSYQIEYTSEDGLNYTRVDSSPETIEFSSPISSAYPEEWNDLIGYFLQVGGVTFEGIFEYKDNVWSYAKIGISTTPEYVYTGKDIYTNSGKSTGTLVKNIINTFDDVNARVYSEIQEQYNAMPVTIAPEAANSLYSNKKLYTIPIKSDGTPLLDTSNATEMKSMFNNCSSLITIPLINTSNVTNMSNMFCNCTNLTMVPQLDTSKVTNMYRMFWGCNSLTTIPLINTSQVTNMEGMFFGCNSLTTVPQLDTSSATNMRYMFDDCSLLTTIPQLDTSNATNMECIFANNESLTTIPQ